MATRPNHSDELVLCVGGTLVPIVPGSVRGQAGERAFEDVSSN